MIDRLYDYLSTRPDGAAAEDLLALVFGDGGGDAAFGRSFLGALLADDPRFVSQAKGDLWRVADKHLLDEPLAEADFVVVDLESTGQRPEEAGITEIGAVRLRGSREVDRFESLVNPSRPIPPYVATLTGITDAMVADAPAIAEVLPRFLAFAAKAVIVAHNAAFDVAVLDRACRQVVYLPLGMPSLCTFKLARRLLPEVTKASLDGLALHFGLAKAARHRALADAELTAAVLVRLVRMFETDGPRIVNDLLEAQDRPDAPRRLDIRIPRGRLESLPESAGVFWLVDAHGQTLYVGQTDDVRSQVVTYFVGRAHLSDRQFEMISQTVDVGFVVAEGRLERALLEAQEVRLRSPVFNRADKHLPRGSFVKIQRRGRFPRTLVAGRISGDGALYLGPIRSRAFADDAAALIAKLFRLRTCPGALHPAPAVEPCWLGPAGWCASPCNATVDVDAYRLLVDEAEAALTSRDPAAMRAYLGRDKGGGEQRGSRDSAVMGRLLKIHRRWHWLVNAHDYVAAFSATGGGLWVAVVVGGCCRRLELVADADELEHALEWGDDLSRSRRMGHLEADYSTIFAHAIRGSGDSDGLLVIDLDPNDLARSLRASVRECAILVDAA